MKKHGRLVKIGIQLKRIFHSKKNVVLLLAIQLCMGFFVSCSNDDDRPLSGSIMLEDDETFVPSRGTCSLDLDLSPVQNVNEIRTYKGSDDNKENNKIIWGFSTEEINPDTEFIKEENLKDFGVKIISLSEDRRVFFVQYLQGFKGIFLGHKVTSQKKGFCSISHYQESGIQ